MKIIARDGRLTLRGPVQSEAEKANIDQKARAIAGITRVVNRLDVPRH